MVDILSPTVVPADMPNPDPDAAVQFLNQFAPKANIKSLAQLLNWFKHRYPAFYYDKFPSADGGTGRRILQLYWAAYLAWAER